MKNIVIKLIKYLYYLFLIALLIIYLFPGSLIGYFLYGDIGRQPNLIQNPIGTSFNHTLAFFSLSMLGFITHLNNKRFNKTIILLLCLSITLELFHYLIPNRSFQFLDLVGNLIGTLSALFIIIFYKKYK